MRLFIEYLVIYYYALFAIADYWHTLLRYSHYELLRYYISHYTQYYYHWLLMPCHADYWYCYYAISLRLFLLSHWHWHYTLCHISAIELLRHYYDERIDITPMPPLRLPFWLIIITLDNIYHYAAFRFWYCWELRHFCHAFIFATLAYTMITYFYTAILFSFLHFTPFRWRAVIITPIQTCRHAEIICHLLPTHDSCLLMPMIFSGFRSIDAMLPLFLLRHYWCY